MVESETIAEVGNVQIIDDGYEDEDVIVQIDGTSALDVTRLEYVETLAPEMSDDFQEAVEIAREWYDNGRSHEVATHHITFESRHGSKCTVDTTSDYDILPSDEVASSPDNDYVVLIDEEDNLADTLLNSSPSEFDEFSHIWYFTDMYVEEV